MAWIFENEYDENGRSVFHREGQLAEATCPKCGYPVPAIIWDSGEIEVELCYECKNEEKERRSL